MTALVDRLEQLAGECTPGEWYYDGRDIFTKQELDDKPMGYLVIPLPETWHQSQEVNKGDVALIVELRNSLPALLTALRAARDAERRFAYSNVLTREEQALRDALAPLFGEDTTP